MHSTSVQLISCGHLISTCSVREALRRPAGWGGERAGAGAGEGEEEEKGKCEGEGATWQE